MKYPTLQEEKKLWKKRYKKVACLDEAGRGPLAGPVVAAAVILRNSKHQAPNSKQYPKTKRVLNFKNCNLFGICDLGFGILKLRDSKKLSPKQREKFYKLITGNKDIRWGIGRVSEKVIDRINILEATKLAMVKAIKKFKRKPDFLILDGKMRINLPISQKSIVKADEKVFSCAAASILAKVTRDKIMRKFHRKYPQYRFDLHKGYLTKLHFKRLKKYGPCKIHRKTFKPLKRIS